MTKAKNEPKRKAATIDVPAIGEDPAERKRVLNVLAQRRYRQKRKQHIKALEARADSTTDESSNSPNTSNTPSSDSTSPASRDTLQANLGYQHVEHRSPCVPFQVSETSPAERIAQEQDESTMFHSLNADMAVCSTDYNYGWDPLIMLPSLPSTPLSSTNTSLTGNTCSPTSVTPLELQTQSLSPVPCSFPDEMNLQMLEARLLHGALAIAQLLNIDDLIWSLTSTSPFTDPAMALTRFDHLPPNLRPTAVQLTQPHHPMIDLLPWPSARDRMILVMSQPTSVRPKVAASPTALVDFVYDLEDSAEGVRIWGDDPYSDQSWEVGEALFSRWWWMFDRAVIRRSNELRRLRGAKMLTAGSILGEVE